MSRRLARSGAEIRVNSPVERILTENGRARGVVVGRRGGVPCSRHRHGRAPEDHVPRAARSHRAPGHLRKRHPALANAFGTGEDNLALAELPEFTADPGFNPDIHGGAIQVLDDLDYLEREFQEARFGKPATLPFSDTAIPTVADPTLAQWVPAQWADEPGHEEELEQDADADYRTPIRGLYQASSATHAGGGVTGIPGHHAVREIMRDKALRGHR